MKKRVGDGHDCIDGLRRDGVGSRNGIQRDVLRHPKTQRAVLHIGPYSGVHSRTGVSSRQKSKFEPWKNATVHCVGYTRITQGKLGSTGSCPSGPIPRATYSLGS